MHTRQESEIVLSAQSGNRNAFEQLVLRYQNLITSLAFSKTGDLQRSEDIAQQAFLIAWEKRADLIEPEKFGSWLRSIAGNVLLNSNRKSKRIARAEVSMELDQTPGNEPGLDQVSTMEQQELLWASLKNIPEQYREPLILFYREEKSVAQVAELMGLSNDAVKQRLSRGRAMLKVEVEQFVEDLLGSTKPSASFAAAVLASLPATASAVGKAAVQSGTALGAKSMLGKLGLLFSGPLLGAAGGLLGTGMGVAGAWYGIKQAEKQATSEEEKKLLRWFFKTILILTLAFAAFTIAAALVSPVGNTGMFIMISSVLYTLVIVGFVFRFTNQQRELHAIHGKPEYLNESKSTYETPATATGYRFSILGASFGMWAWLLVLAAVNSNWIVLSVALITMIGHVGWRLAIADQFTTVVSQMRNHVSNIMINTVLAAVIVSAADWFGLPINYDGVSGWTMGLFVLMIGLACAAGISVGATSIEKRNLKSGASK